MEIEEKKTKEEILTENQENVEGLFFMLENEENDTQCNEKETEAQERTKINKKLFLENYEFGRGVISIICDKIGIDRVTYYRWKESDPEFVKALDRLKLTLNDEVEDILMSLIKVKRDPSCVKYWLDRRDPRYRPKQELGGLNGEPLPPIKVEIISPKNGNTNTTENNTGDSSLSKEPGKSEENKGE
jgi:hypothetical protein